MRIKELTNAPQWLLDAVVQEEDVTIDAHGRVQWHSGNFLGGNFWGGNFLGGDFRGGDFWGGDFWGGNFRGGNFRGGDFWGGNFRGGNFRGGDFWGGNFLGGDFRGEKLTIKPLCVYGLTWRVIITGEQMEIGCQRHTHTEWAEFDDSAISVMESHAADFWVEHKAMLLSMCALHAQRSKADK
jgi:hypothetical protein